MLDLAGPHVGEDRVVSINNKVVSEIICDQNATRGQTTFLWAFLANLAEFTSALRQQACAALALVSHSIMDR